MHWTVGLWGRTYVQILVHAPGMGLRLQKRLCNWRRWQPVNEGSEFQRRLRRTKSHLQDLLTSWP
jgi:hypothetical protein